MITIAKLDANERRTYFEQAAASHGALSAQLMEKDFWVCWTLQRVFGVEEFADHITFKGGTSLSKVYHVIERFSEDVDLSIERAFLGFGGENEPEQGGSGKEKQRRIDRLKETCQSVIHDRLLPLLRESFDTQLRQNEDEHWSLELDDEDRDRQTLRFTYPRAVIDKFTDYFPPSVKIELGARSDHYPVETGNVRPYLTEQLELPEVNDDIEVKVLCAERTFWEKATILHAECHRPEGKPIPKRQSRHYYDLSSLADHKIGQSALKQTDLLARVAEHKSVFFRSGWANYDAAVPGSLSLIPPDDRLTELASDYQDMVPMFFGEAPTFGRIISRLQLLQERINAIEG